MQNDAIPLLIQNRQPPRPVTEAGDDHIRLIQQSERRRVVAIETVQLQTRFWRTPGHAASTHDQFPRVHAETCETENPSRQRTDIIRAEFGVIVLERRFHRGVVDAQLMPVHQW